MVYLDQSPSVPAPPFRRVERIRKARSFSIRSRLVMLQADQLGLVSGRSVDAREGLAAVLRRAASFPARRCDRIADGALSAVCSPERAERVREAWLEQPGSDGARYAQAGAAVHWPREGRRARPRIRGIRELGPLFPYCNDAYFSEIARFPLFLSDCKKDSLFGLFMF